ncbi:hypothetical protein PSAC2689_80041 [Paraburkholderia sacchari]
MNAAGSNGAAAGSEKCNRSGAHRAGGMPARTRKRLRFMTQRTRPHDPRRRGVDFAHVHRADRIRLAHRDFWQLYGAHSRA